ncbi:glycosyltransferase [Pedobacter sp. Leaf170]|uniref:glycosyltransferase family 2 protein n=1 Tax=Pedobacter sp. Leaf170 TaxID=2876558 RepID=UPI001E4F5508|nr:glycosyltransferase [Pedobacter sp. Leaf170]
MPDISIIICCYNSAERLPKTIEHISKIENIESQIEIIIVDNCSTDATSKVAELELNRYSKNIDYHIVHESRPGLYNARKRGCQVANYDWLLFCDDDNWLERDYIINFLKNLNEYPHLEIFGCGISNPVFEKQPQKWFYKYQYLCAIFNIEERKKNVMISNSMEVESFVCGAGMYVRKEFINAYFSDYRFKLVDRIGEALSSGGDTDLVWFALSNNLHVGQFSNLKLQHYITANRITKKYIIRLYMGISFSFALLDYKYKSTTKKPRVFEFFYHYVNNLLHFNFLISRLIYAEFIGRYKAYRYIQTI